MAISCSIPVYGGDTLKKQEFKVFSGSTPDKVRQECNDFLRNNPQIGVVGFDTTATPAVDMGKGYGGAPENFMLTVLVEYLKPGSKKRKSKKGEKK